MPVVNGTIVANANGIQIYYSGGVERDLIGK